MTFWFAGWNEIFIPPCIPYRITSTKRRINTDVSPDDGHIIARNIHRKEINKLRKILHQVGFMYKIVQGCTVKKNIKI
jgi:G:T-mismatch repair DNA endonuclease (very short patch repair protein)